ncbi:MAG: hypothetical protein H6706_08220 [Myxococcales bacterium]|nr:hypothetical protein [Myxococcales bacterium]
MIARSPLLGRPALALALALPACSDAVVDVEVVEEAPVAAGRYGLVVISADLGQPGVAISGQWMAYDGMGRADALLALAAPEHALLADAPPSMGSCRLLDAEARRPAAGSRVDLLDAGTLTVLAPAPLTEAVHIAPRELPPLIAALAGVVYDADADLPYLAGGRYDVRAEGADVGPVMAHVEAPQPSWIEGHQVDDAGLEIRLGGAADPIVLLSRQVGRRSLFAACRPVEGADTLRMPTEALRHLGPGPASLAALRIARTPLALEGLDGALLFVTRDATELTLPEPGIPEEPVR